jgi:hypothetical protein
MRIPVLLILIVSSGNICGEAAERYIFAEDEAPLFRRSALVSVESGELAKLESQLCGAYQFPLDILHGCVLHLYPGGAAHLIEFSDTSRDAPIARGNWRIAGAFVEVDWHFVPDQRADIRSWVERRYGEIRQFVVFRDEVQPELPVLFVIASSRNVGRFRTFMERRVQYVDWPRYKNAIDETFGTPPKRLSSP